VRMGKWKGIKRDLRKTPDAPLELYNLAEDISETTDVVKEHPAVAEKIEGIIRRERTAPVLEKFRFGTYHD
jgi:hypothetical protein